MSDLSRQAQNLLDQARDLDGVEWCSDWDDDPAYKELVEKDLIDLGPARGPGRKWRRLVLKGEPIT